MTLDPDGATTGACGADAGALRIPKTELNALECASNHFSRFSPPRTFSEPVVRAGGAADFLTLTDLVDTISPLSTAQETTDMVRINPSLMFSGACGDAFRRYASLFGGEIVLMLTYGESPAKSQVPDDWHEKVWFARLRAGGLDITGGDLASSETPSGFSMVIGVANATEVDRVFAGLADGGEVLMPLQDTHWSPRYGVVRDPFGIRWEINCDAERVAEGL